MERRPKSEVSYKGVSALCCRCYCSLYSYYFASKVEASTMGRQLSQRLKLRKTIKNNGTGTGQRALCGSENVETARKGDSLIIYGNPPRSWAHQ